MSERDEVKVCSICGSKYTGWGNNAWPVNDGRCCDRCNGMYVIGARLRMLNEQRKKESK